MADIPISPQQTLQQALQTLATAPANSPVQKQAVQVIVAHLSSRHITLQVNNDKVDIPLQKGVDTKNVKPLSLYQVSVSQVQTGQISPTPNNLPDSESSAKAMGYLLNLFNPVSIGKSVAASTQQIQAIISALASKPPAEIKGALPVQFSGTVQSISTKQASVLINDIDGKKASLPVDIDLAANRALPKQISKGDRVSVTLNVVRGEWQTTLSKTNTVSAANIAGIKQYNVDVGAKALAILLGSTLQQATGKQQNTLSIPLNDLPRALNETIKQVVSPNTASKVTSRTLSKNESLLLTLNLTGHPKVSLLSLQPVAKLPITQSIVNKLAIAGLQTDKVNPPVSKLEQSFQADKKHFTNQADDRVTLQEASTPKSSRQLKEADGVNLSALKTTLASLPLPEKVSALRRYLMAEQSPPSQVLNNLLVAPDSKQGINQTSVVKQVLTELSQSLPSANRSDAEQIRQLVISPALVTSPTQVLSPSTPSTWLNGLMTVVNIALQARNNRTQSEALEKLTTLVGTLRKGGHAASPPRTATMSDLGNLEQRQALLKALGQLLNGHLNSKLISAEQMSQGTDSLYFVLPHLSGQRFRDIELLIKREPEKQEQQDKSAGNLNTWRLTMKLAVGELGDMLAKAALTEDKIELDIYTSNATLRDAALNYLPLLKKRLQSHGLEVGQTRCQLGKIPAQLHRQPYQIFETQA